MVAVEVAPLVEGDAHHHRLAFAWRQLREERAVERAKDDVVDGVAVFPTPRLDRREPLGAEREQIVMARPGGVASPRDSPCRARVDAMPRRRDEPHPPHFAAQPPPAAVGRGRTRVDREGAAVGLGEQFGAGFCALAVGRGVIDADRQRVAERPAHERDAEMGGIARERLSRLDNGATTGPRPRRSRPHRRRALARAKRAAPRRRSGIPRPAARR